MKTQTYNKLIRDKIPEIIATNQQIASVKTLSTQDCLKALKLKLIEEVEEFNESETLDELADILEVVFALAQHIGADHHQLESVRAEKQRARGGFEKRLFLETVTTIN
ncbi:MAG: phosphoribosyl-ATP pyrophosphohydrolase [Anaerolineae bacterium]